MRPNAYKLLIIALGLVVISGPYLLYTNFYTKQDTALSFFLLPLFVIGVFIIAMFIAIALLAKVAEKYMEFLERKENELHEKTVIALDEISVQNPDFDRKFLKQKVEDIFKEAQKALNKWDEESLRKLTTADGFRILQEQQAYFKKSKTTFARKVLNITDVKFLKMKFQKVEGMIRARITYISKDALLNEAGENVGRTVELEDDASRSKKIYFELHYINGQWLLNMMDAGYTVVPHPRYFLTRKTRLILAASTWVVALIVALIIGKFYRPEPEAVKYGFIEGVLSYPADGIPDDISICAKKLQSGYRFNPQVPDLYFGPLSETSEEIYCTNTHIQDQKFRSGKGYNLKVPVGLYLVYATPPRIFRHPDKNYRAYYTNFIPCIYEHAENWKPCNLLHTPIIASIQPGVTIKNIDPGDWYQ